MSTSLLRLIQTGLRVMNCDYLRCMSAYPAGPDISVGGWDVAFVPTADIPNGTAKIVNWLSLPCATLRYRPFNRDPWPYRSSRSCTLICSLAESKRLYHWLKGQRLCQSEAH